MQRKRIGEIVLYLAILVAGILYLVRGQVELALPQFEPRTTVTGRPIPK